MDAWTDRIQNGKLPELALAISASIAEVRRVPTTAEDDAWLSRVDVVVSYVHRRLANADGRLVPINTMDSVESRLGSIQSELAGYVADRSSPHLIAADGQCDALLGELRGPELTSRRSLSQTASATKAFSDTVATIEQDLLAAQSDFDGRVAAAASRLADVQSSADRQLAELVTARDEHLGATKAVMEAHAADITAQKARIETFIQNGTTNLTTEQERLAKDFRDARDRLAETNVNALTVLDEEWTSNFSAMEARLTTTLAFFQSREAEANRILGAEAARSTAGAYLQEHTEQRKAADRWRTLALIAWALAVGLGLWTSYDIVHTVGALDGAQLTAVTTGRLAGASAAAGAAVWISRQAGHHRKREQSAIAIASELTTLRPFIAELSIERQHAILEEKLDRYFPGKTGVTNAKGA